MTISKRTLENWRSNALSVRAEEQDLLNIYEGTAAGITSAYITAQRHIEKLTQELLDINLLKRNGRS